MPAKSNNPPEPVDAGSAEPEYFAVRTRRVFEDVVAQIRMQIEQGMLQAGQRLPSERELADQFAVSRTGVREALRSLELAGLLEARSGIQGGFFIRASGSHGVTQAVRDMLGLAQVSVHTLTQARIEITNAAIRMACRNATDADLQALAADIEHHEALEARGRASRDSREVTHFYHLLAEATHNAVMVAIVDAVSENLRVLLARLEPKPHPDMLPARRRVVEQIRLRDADAASAAMTEFFNKLDAYLARRSAEPRRKPG